jgi:hypothetical protein
MEWTGFIIGNGESRLNFDLNKLRSVPCRIAGCNRLYEDFEPDFLVSLDPRFYKKVKKNYKGIYFYPDFEKKEILSSNGYHKYKHRKWASGPTAIWIMCERFGRKYINRMFLLGFDFYSKTNRINNIYKNTFGYAAEDAKAVDPKRWLEECEYIFLEFPFIKFYRVMPDNWNNIEKFDNDFKNYEQINYEQLEKFLKGETL